VIIIKKFSSQLYIITQSRRAINNYHLIQKLNSKRVILLINIYKKRNFYYILRRVIRINQRVVNLIFKKKSYPILVKNCNSNIILILIIKKCSKIISLKFKVVKFIQV